MKVVELPGDLDPDAFIQQHGAAAYSHRLDTAVSYFHWLTARARDKFDLGSVEGRVDAFKWILPAIEQVNHPMERAEITREISA